VWLSKDWRGWNLWMSDSELLPSHVTPAQVVAVLTRDQHVDALVLVPNAEAELLTLREAILTAYRLARERRQLCPFCLFDPCLDRCLVQVLKSGSWLTLQR
jgi:hypothetical protein